MTRIIVVDDQQLLRRGLRMLLSTVDGFEVVGEAADGVEALEVIERERPEVVLSDLRMPRLDGVGLIAAAAARFPGVPVIALTTFDDDDLVQDALGAGAAGFVLKSVSTDALAESIRQVLAGGLVIDPAVARAAMRRPSPAGAATAAAPAPATGAPAGPDASGPHPLDALTPTERLVAERVAAGATNREIAASLFIAEGTVKNHVSALLRKLGRRDRTALALFVHDALR